MGADGGAGEAVGVAELAGEIGRLDEHLAGCGGVAGVIEGDAQRQQQVEADTGGGMVGELQCGERPAQVAGGVFEGQLAGGVEGGLLGVPDRLQRGGPQAQ